MEMMSAIGGGMLEPLGGAWLAQAAGDAGAGAAHITSIWDFLVKGGVLMIPIGLCSLIALTVIVERAISLRRRNIIPSAFLPGLTAALGRDRSDREAGLAYCRQAGSPIAAIFAAALRHAHEPQDRLEKQVEQAGERELLRLRKYLRTLAVIVGVAPMLGLLGTVFGMIEAFRTVATSAEALGQTEALAEGIYQALITTAAGLLVAIPAMIGHHWLAARVEGLVSEMDSLTVEFVEALRTGGSTGPVVTSGSMPAAQVVPAQSAAAGTPSSAGGAGAPRAAERAPDASGAASAGLTPAPAAS